MANICLDFDGVLHDHSNIAFNNRPDAKMGPPIHGALEAVNGLLALGHKLTISTCRLNDNERYWIDQPVVVRPPNHVEKWLDYFDFPIERLTVTYIKPIAHLYIDDRGLRFHSWSQALADLHELEAQDAL